MKFLLIGYLLALFLSWGWSFSGRGRTFLVVILPLLFLDCLGNAIVTKGSFRNTLSAEAWRHDNHPVWGFWREVIDTLFFLQDGHCRIQSDREYVHGSVWRAWMHDFRQNKW